MEKFPSIVEDIMSSPVVTIDGEYPVKDAALLMTEKQIGSIIIMERGQAVGIVTERDILERVVSKCKDPCETKMKDIMSTPLISITKDAGILEAMRKMRENKIRRLLVIEENKQIGIVSEKDVMRAVSFASLASFRPLIRKSR